MPLKTQSRHEAEQHPMVQAVIAAFPKAKITEIRTEAGKAQEALHDALPEVDEEWDPFDEDPIAKQAAKPLTENKRQRRRDADAQRT